MKGWVRMAPSQLFQKKTRAFIPIVLLINMNWSVTVICKTWVKLDLLGYLCILRKVFWFQSPFSVLDSHHLWIELQKWYGLRFAGNLGCRWKEWRFRREHFYQMKKRVVSPFGVDLFFGCLWKTTFGVTSASIIYLWCIHELEVFQQPHPWSVPPPPKERNKNAGLLLKLIERGHILPLQEAAWAFKKDLTPSAQDWPTKSMDLWMDKKSWMRCGCWKKQKRVLPKNLTWKLIMIVSNRNLLALGLVLRLPC